MYTIDPRAKLREQLQYLANSCNAYDGGQKAEAIRIATVVRVLIHDTKASISLLSHLRAKTIQLVSTTLGQPDPDMKFFHGMGMARETPDGNRELIPNFSALGPTSLLPVDAWWNQTIFVLESGEALTRRDVVLSASNQDGGAHVDVQVGNEYRALATDGAAGTYFRPAESGYIEVTASNMHLVALRQIAFELLNSSELTGLGK